MCFTMCSSFHHNKGADEWMIKRNILSNLSVAVVKESLMYLRKSEDLPTPNSPHKITFCSGIFTLAIFICLFVVALFAPLFSVFSYVLLYFLHRAHILEQPSARIWKSVWFGRLVSKSSQTGDALWHIATGITMRRFQEYNQWANIKSRCHFPYSAYT